MLFFRLWSAGSWTSHRAQHEATTTPPAPGNLAFWAPGRPPLRHPPHLHQRPSTTHSALAPLRSPQRARPDPFLTDLPASRKYLFSTHDYGRLRSNRDTAQPLRGPDCTLSRLPALKAEEHDWRVTQSTATPEPGCSGPHPRLSRSSLTPLHARWHTLG